MLPDTVEYGQWKSGVRDESIGFGLNMLAQKAGSGVGVGLLGLILGMIGYAENQAQTPQTLEGIRAVAFLPAIAMQALSLAVIWFYPIDTAFHRKLVDEISAATPASASS